MTNLEKRGRFIEDVSKKYPKIKILEFCGLSDGISFIDEDGYLHYKKQARRLLSNGYNIQSIVNKKSFIQDKVDKLNTKLKVLEYKGIKNKVLVQDENGFTYSPQCYDLLNGHKVTIETCNEKEGLFITMAKRVHNCQYEYPKFTYKNGKQKVDISCKKHGIFNQTIESHLQGKGCQKCKSEISSFSKSKWIENNIGKICTFYVLRFYNEEECFIKVGVTSKNVNSRYKKLKAYRYEKLIEINGDSETISGIETRVLKKYKSYKYTPKLKFEGSTECLELIVKEKLYEQFKK